MSISRQSVDKQTDLLIVGGGIAGSYAAFKASQLGLKVVLVLKTNLQGGSTLWAQGGIAVPLDQLDRQRHLLDTLTVGRGLCEVASVRAFVAEAQARLADLVDLGVSFDPQSTVEAGHSQARILHAYGDATGRSISEVLSRVVQTDPAIDILKGFVYRLLLSDGGRVIGVEGLVQGHIVRIQAGAVLLATGGAGHLYPHTTAPPECTGDGLAMAYRAGAQLRDLEFVQFHPTVCIVAGQSLLITEAARGEGGILRNAYGERFMSNYDVAAELAPRDVVSRAVANEQQRTGAVTLDLTHLGADFVQQRFPNIFKRLLKFNVDISAHPIPVTPAAHYTIGGISTDAWGQTTLPGLYAAGEVASSGLHGANRLASNSLSEGLVFGYRAVQAAADSLRLEPPSFQTDTLAIAPDSFNQVQQIMATQAGLVRDARGLTRGLEALPQAYQQQGSQSDIERGNLTLLARLVLESALIRTESRGVHWRSDYSDLAAVSYHVVHQKGAPAAQLARVTPDTVDPKRDPGSVVLNLSRSDLP